MGIQKKEWLSGVGVREGILSSTGSKANRVQLHLLLSEGPLLLLSPGVAASMLKYSFLSQEMLSERGIQ